MESARRSASVPGCCPTSSPGSRTWRWRRPFHVSFVTVYGLAVWDVRPPQSWVILCPAVNVTRTVQVVVVVVPVLVTVTPPWNPSVHWPCWA